MLSCWAVVPLPNFIPLLDPVILTKFALISTSVLSLPIVFEVGDSTQANITAATYNNVSGDLTITIDATHDSFIGNRHFLSGMIFSCAGGEKVYPNDGYGFRFATNYTVTSRSPYIRNVTVITKGTTTSASDPRGFASGDAGKGAYVDGAYATASSKEASMLFL